MVWTMSYDVLLGLFTLAFILSIVYIYFWLKRYKPEWFNKFDEEVVVDEGSESVQCEEMPKQV